MKFAKKFLQMDTCGVSYFLLNIYLWKSVSAKERMCIMLWFLAISKSLFGEKQLTSYRYKYDWFEAEGWWI